MIESPDRVPRKEVYEKRSWSKQTIGKILLPKGMHQLVLTAASVNKGEVAEFNAVILKRVIHKKK